MNDSLSPERLLVIAPRGRDAQLACDLLARGGFVAEACSSLRDLSSRIGHAPGAVLLAEEALADGGLELFLETLERQPPWSDLPLIVFGGATQQRTGPALARLMQTASVTVLERPLGVRALTTAVAAALRARRRQYVARREIDQRDEFLAMLGHELRNPLGSICLAIEVLDVEHSAVRGPIDILRRQSAHLTRLVDDLLHVARVTSGRIELRRAPVDLVALLTRVVAQYQVTADDSGLRLRWDAPAGPIVVDGDVVRLEQVFGNLLTNSIKYTPEGGCIDVELGVVAGLVTVRVIDTGVGISATTLPHVFDLFVQARGSIDRARGGLGIGLTLVRRLVELHGGSVSVASAGLGKGSEFSTTLPVIDAAVALVGPPALATTTTTATSGARQSVVIVEDAEDLRLGLHDLLVELGHDVEMAGDGVSGLERILAVLPAVALIDIGLPGIDGYEVCRRARAVVGDRVRLFAISGYGQPQDKRAAEDAGFDRHFTKPIDLPTLLSVLGAADAA